MYFIGLLVKIHDSHYDADSENQAKERKSLDLPPLQGQQSPWGASVIAVIWFRVAAWLMEW